MLRAAIFVQQLHQFDGLGCALGCIPNHLLGTSIKIETWFLFTSTAWLLAFSLTSVHWALLVALENLALATQEFVNDVTSQDFKSPQTQRGFVINCYCKTNFVVNSVGFLTLRTYQGHQVNQSFVFAGFWNPEKSHHFCVSVSFSLRWLFFVASSSLNASFLSIW